MKIKKARKNQEKVTKKGKNARITRDAIIIQQIKTVSFAVPAIKAVLIPNIIKRKGMFLIAEITKNFKPITTKISLNKMLNYRRRIGKFSLITKIRMKRRKKMTQLINRGADNNYSSRRSTMRNCKLIIMLARMKYSSQLKILLGKQYKNFRKSILDNYRL